MRRETPQTLIRDVGRRIAELRQAAGRTQEELAHALGLTARYLQGVDAGKNLTLDSLAQIAAGLGVRAADLLVTPSSPDKRRPGRPTKVAGRR